MPRALDDHGHRRREGDLVRRSPHRDRQATARPQRATEAAQGFERIAGVHERGPAQHHVVVAGFQLGGLGVGLDERHVGQAGRPGPLLGEGEHVAGDVEARDVAVLAHLGGGTEPRFAVARSDVEDDIAGPQASLLEEGAGDGPARAVGFDDLEPPPPSRRGRGPLPADGVLVVLVGPGLGSCHGRAPFVVLPRRR